MLTAPVGSVRAGTTLLSQVSRVDRSSRMSPWQIQGFGNIQGGRRRFGAFGWGWGQGWRVPSAGALGPGRRRRDGGGGRHGAVRVRSSWRRSRRASAAGGVAFVGVADDEFPWPSARQ